MTPTTGKPKTRELEHTVRDLTTAIIDIQNRLSRLDGEELQWPGDTYEPSHTEPVGTGSERVRELENRVELIVHDTPLGRYGPAPPFHPELRRLFVARRHIAMSPVRPLPSPRLVETGRAASTRARAPPAWKSPA